MALRETEIGKRPQLVPDLLGDGAGDTPFRHAGEQAGAAPGDSRRDVAAARLIRARELVAGASPDRIAVAIAAECGSSRIRARRLALGIALADVVAQVRARYQADGRRVPVFRTVTTTGAPVAPSGTAMES